MRVRSIVSMLAPFAVILGAGVSSRAQDFDPNAHGHHHGGNNPHPGPGPGPAPSPSAPKKSPIERAVEIALARPGESGPVLKLSQLYRERDGSLDAGLAFWKSRAASGAFADVITYAGLLKANHQTTEAKAAYQQAINIKPDFATAYIALAQLEIDSNDTKAGYDHYQKALSLQKERLDRETTLRTLMDLAVQLKDIEAAKSWHAELMKTNPNSLAVKAELGRIFMKHELRDEAEAQFEEVVRASAGDPRVMGNSLLDLGQVQTALQKYDKAIATLKKALDVVGASSIRMRVLNALADVYRAQNKIEEFVALLEKDNPGDADRQELLGRLAAEIDTDKAIVWLSKAVASDSRRIEARLLLIRLLKQQSKLDEVLKQYEALISGPGAQADYVFEYCDLLIGRGDRAKCKGNLKSLENSTDPETLSRLAAYYSQIGEESLALALMEKLAAKNTQDPSYIVDLGDYFYQRDDGKNKYTDKAKEIWRRLLTMVTPKEKALLTLGQVYLDHNLQEDALSVLLEANQLAPKDWQVLKALATAYQRTNKSDLASATWENIVFHGDKSMRREARTQLVQLWLTLKSTDAQVARLSAMFKGPPQDNDAGRLLAELHLRLRHLDAAETTLRAVIAGVPGDVESRLVLEQILKTKGDLPGAIAILQELLQADPKGALAYYGRLANYSLALYRDEDALRYAASAVELSPLDPDGHRKLAELYRSQQQFAPAIREFQLALKYAPKDWPVYFELASLLLAEGNELEADTLYRSVIRGCRDDELVAQAIRFSIAINQKRGTLEIAEGVLLPISLGNPQKVVYRRLLVDLYRNLAAPLIAKIRADAPDSADAREKLKKIGIRGSQPLIDALTDTDLNQQNTAIEILTFTNNRAAAPALFAYATAADKHDQSADTHTPYSPYPYGGYGGYYRRPTVQPLVLQLRTRAMWAASAVADSSMIPRYESTLFQTTTTAQTTSTHFALGGYDSIADAAGFVLTRVFDSKSAVLSKRILQSNERLPEGLRAFATLNLGMSKDTANLKLFETLAGTTSSQSYSERAAGFYALGDLANKDSKLGEKPVVELLFQQQSSVSNYPIVRAMALVALTKIELRSNPKTPSPKLIDALQLALFDRDASLRQAAVLGFVSLATGQMRNGVDRLSVPSDPAAFNNFQPMLESLLRTNAYTNDDFAKAMEQFEPKFEQATLSALQLASDRYHLVLASLSSTDGRPAFGVFTPDDRGRALAEKIAQVAQGSIESAVTNSDTALASKAAMWLARRNNKSAESALIRAIGDPRLDVRRLVLSLLADHGTSYSFDAINNVLTAPTTEEGDSEWTLRLDAAHALGAIMDREKSTKSEDSLAHVATSDSNAFVREAALSALFLAHCPRARAIATQLSTGDSEVHVRTFALDLLKNAPATP